MSPKDQIELFLRTGKDDPFDPAWPGESFIERARSCDKALRKALIKEVVKRVPRAETPVELVGLDVDELASKKIGPMVRGLFPASEQQVVMRTLSRSIIFLTSENIAPTILNAPFLSTAWQLANLYLVSCGVAPLSDEAPEIVGLSEGTTCYVSSAYFAESQLTDFVIHEVAHVFHNCKRKTIGLPEIRGREWLLEIDFHKREMFAYACEAYGCIAAQGRSAADRRRLLAQITDDWMPPDESVDRTEYLATLHEAVDARNGWKRILKRCSPPARRRSAPLALCVSEGVAS
jgi:hypothetical protein